MLAFGLPGNPASAAVTFALVVSPVLRALSGWNGGGGGGGGGGTGRGEGAGEGKGAAGGAAGKRRRSSDIEGFLPRRIGVTIDRDTPTDASRPEYARASLRWEGGGGGGGSGGEEKEGKEGRAENAVGRFVATNTGNQISSRLLSMKGADVLLELPSGGGVFEKGRMVSALVYRDLRDMVLE